MHPWQIPALPSRCAVSSAAPFIFEREYRSGHESVLPPTAAGHTFASSQRGQGKSSVLTTMGSSPYQQEEGGLPRREEFSHVINIDSSSHGDSSSKQFLRSLRTLLLRIRMAVQLRQDFVVEKHFVELKDLCRSVCAELGTTTTAFEDLWAVVQQRRGDAGSSNQHSSGEFINMNCLI